MQTTRRGAMGAIIGAFAWLLGSQTNGSPAPEDDDQTGLHVHWLEFYDIEEVAVRLFGQSAVDDLKTCYPELSQRFDIRFDDELRRFKYLELWRTYFIQNGRWFVPEKYLCVDHAPHKRVEPDEDGDFVGMCEEAEADAPTALEARERYALYPRGRRR